MGELSLIDRLIERLIAATALIRGMTAVTRHGADFWPMGVAVFNPWAL